MRYNNHALEMRYGALSPKDQQSEFGSECVTEINSYWLRV